MSRKTKIVEVRAKVRQAPLTVADLVIYDGLSCESQVATIRKF